MVDEIDFFHETLALLTKVTYKDIGARKYTILSF